MASLDEFRALLGQVNEQTTEIGAAITDVASDIETLISQLGTTVPQEVIDGLTSVVGTLGGHATTLKSVAEQFPPPGP